MTISFSNLWRPMEVANRLQNEMQQHGRDIDVLTARAHIAIMFGYENWAHLSQSCGTTQESVDDYDCEQEIVHARFLNQCRAIEVLAGSFETAEDIIKKIHPTRRIGNSRIIWNEKSHQLSWYAYGDHFAYGIFKEENLRPDLDDKEANAYRYHIRRTETTHFPRFASVFSRGISDQSTVSNAKEFAERVIAEEREKNGLLFGRLCDEH